MRKLLLVAGAAVFVFGTSAFATMGTSQTKGHTVASDAGILVAQANPNNAGGNGGGCNVKVSPSKPCQINRFNSP